MSLPSAVDRFIRNTDLTDQVVHGDKDTVVQTDGGPVPSLAKLLADSERTIAEAVESQLDLEPRLAAPGGADLVTTANGSTVQAALGDLASALNAKEPKITTGTPLQYLRGDKTLSNFANDVRNASLGTLYASTTAIASGDSIATAMGKAQGQINKAENRDNKGGVYGYLGLNVNRMLLLPSADGSFNSVVDNANTASRTYSLPDKSGTFAMLSDLPSAPSGGLVLLGSATVTTGVLSINFLNIFSPIYEKYFIEVQGLAATSTTSPRLQFASGGVLTTASYYRFATATQVSTGNTSTVAFNLTFDNLPANTFLPAAMIEVSNPNFSSGGGVLTRWASAYYNAGLGAYMGVGIYSGPANPGISGFAINSSTGALFNFGTVRIWGLKGAA